MDIGATSDAIVKVCEKSFRLLSSEHDIRVVNRWLILINKNIRLILKAIKTFRYNPGTISKLQSNLGHLKRFKAYITEARHTGAGAVNIGNRVKWEDTDSAFKNRIRSAVIINLKHKDLLQFLNEAFVLLGRRLPKILKTFNIIKINAVFCGEFIKKSQDEIIMDLKYFSTKNFVLDRGTDLKTWYTDTVVESIMHKLEEFNESSSGWSLHRILSLEININKVEMGNGATYVKLPKSILKKKACVNILNNDNACFAWAVVSAIYPVEKNSGRTSGYPHYSQVLNLDGIEFPVTLPQISRFEKLNNISVNVFALEMISKENSPEKFRTCPVRLTKKELERHVNLLLVQDRYFPEPDDFRPPSEPVEDDFIPVTSHYVWIRNLSRLISSQTNKHNGKVYICNRCLNYFATKVKLDDHKIYCQEINTCQVEFPKDKFIKFKNFVNKERTPYVIYADLETMLKPCHDTNVTSHTVKYQNHVAYSAGFYLKCSFNNSLSFYRSYRGTDCLSWFADQMEEVAKDISLKLKTVEPMTEKIDLKDATANCHICEKRFGPDDIVVRDHCHLTSKFRGYAHQSCNLNYRNSFMIPVVFHNFSGYDSHFIIRDLAKRNRIALLPVNKEKYISFTVFDNETNVKFRFIDSFRFMGFALEELASSLTQTDMINTKNEFRHVPPHLFTLLTRKGVFCYDYIDNLEKLQETSLPPIEMFYNKLKDESIQEKDYRHAQTVWEQFEIKTIGEYSDLYLKTDIMLLTDIFETFRKTSHDNYGLDPAWYYTMPGYTWDCMLKFTGCRLETFQDVDMLLFCERGVRGGISQCCKRFSQANNKYMKKKYNINEPSKYLLYVDVNNLYGWAMCQSLPYGGFRWVDEKDFEHIDVTQIADDAEEGYILEVDLEYPEDLHDLHRDLPFAAEHCAPPGSKLAKLMTTLWPKEKYVIHYRALKQALKHGLVLKKIHRVLRVKQSAWLAPYINFNTNLRAKSKFKFEQTILKLMNNAIYGKTMQNIRKHRRVKLVNKWEGRYGAKHLISSPAFKSRFVFDEDLISVELNKTHVIFDKPLYVGMAILDISKTCVYEFHYDFMLQRFDPSHCQLLYIDTDGLMYEIHCSDVYHELISKNLHRFDTSDYPSNNIYQIPQVNKKVPGLMKDELNGSILTTFIGLRSKMYTYLYLTEKEKCVKKAKGVKKAVLKNHITYKDYKDCLFGKQEKMASQCSIRSFAHKVFSIKQRKVGLSPFDNKRYIVDNIHTLPWGHKDIMDF